jgi:MFS family permease
MISTAGELNQPVATSRRLILWLVLLAQFVVVLDGTIVAVALPAIESSLHFASQLSLQWVINASALLFGGFLLLGGRAGDLYGRRTLFVTGLALFTAASLANGLAQSTETLIAGRAVQGLGGALVTPAALAIIIATFTDTTERTKALGIFASVSAGGAAAGSCSAGSSPTRCPGAGSSSSMSRSAPPEFCSPCGMCRTAAQVTARRARSTFPERSR